VLAVALLAVIVVGLTHPFWLTRTAGFLVVNEEPAPCDLIIVLSGGDERIVHGIRLYRAGYAAKVWLSFGRSEAPDVFDIASVHFSRAVDFIRSQGLTAQDMVIDERALSTYDEARLAKEYVTQRRLLSAIVVSSPFHMRRTAMIFRRVFRDTAVHLTFCGVPLDDEKLSLDRWWTRERELIWVNNEYCKLLLYYFKYVL
jgi:uncharacterized SAM-binding protein YcdF (DUF218 family)